MTLRECYEMMCGDYDGVTGRLVSESLVRKFALKFLNDPSFGQLQAAIESGASADSLDAAAKDSIKGSLNVLDKSLSVLDSTSSMRKAGRTMKDTMDNEWNDMEDDNNFLNMDPNAEKVSFTSDENAEPNTLQIIMRTEEISVDDDAELLDAETAKADVNPLERMWNMLVQMVRAIIEIFKNR